MSRNMVQCIRAGSGRQPRGSRLTGESDWTRRGPGPGSLVQHYSLSGKDEDVYLGGLAMGGRMGHAEMWVWGTEGGTEKSQPSRHPTTSRMGGRR